jgi:hypothetical protein
MRISGFILVSGLALLLAGCSGRLSPGTEGTLNEGGAIAASAHFMKADSWHGSVAAGTKVRVVSDVSSDDGSRREITVLMLEGPYRNENAFVGYGGIVR